MSIRDYNKVINIYNGITGELIDSLYLRKYSKEIINLILIDTINRHLLEDESDLNIKIAYDCKK